MKKTVLITGSSTGIGHTAALYFQEKGWNVVATMRRPDQAGDWVRREGITAMRLDVLDSNSIRRSIDDAIAKFNRIDVIVNNAGYGLVGPFEASTEEQIRRQYDTNVFGLMNVCREILPHFRAVGGGVLINVASVGGRITFPLYSLYHGTKWAVEGFSESLQYELRPFNIRVKIIEPGPIKTDFYDRSLDVMSKHGLSAYDAFVAKALPNLNRAGETAPGPEIVAETIYRAATDSSWRIRYPVNSMMLLVLRKLLPDRLFHLAMRAAIVR